MLLGKKMAAEDFLITTSQTVNELAVKMGALGRWMQALGLMVFLWVLVQAMNFLIVFRKTRQVSRIGKKLDKKI